MSELTLRCIRAAFVFLACGIALGAAFALDRPLGAALRPLHAELNLWGWVTLLIYGMAYHMLPRFAGRPLPRTRVANVQAWLAIGGVVLAAAGWLAALGAPALAPPLRALGGAAQLGAALLFAGLIGALLWRR
jgi:heme/copper-type cytochrome/quinol oxidase subunit 1